MPNDLFLTERFGDTLVLTPTVNLSELEYADSMTQGPIDPLADPAIRNLVMDFHRIDYFGSTALGFFIRLRKQIQERNGRMAFCNLSAHQREILEVTRLDDYWTIHPSREAALAAIQAG